MKRTFKKAWIGVLAITALFVGACCSNRTVEINGQKMTKKELKARVDELKAIVEEREMSCVYGSPEIIEQYGRETSRLRSELNQMQQELDNFCKRK
ncbi:MAG: hypothetical protein IKU00_08660 [Bacteroidales bacterium]|nr:hypothetical protein [Bacteroidales bacterium]